MATRSIFGILLLSALMLGAGSAGAEEPRLHDVYQAAEAGRLGEAQRMMGQVLRDHPDSAKAHYVEAELLAREGRYGNAATELAIAERLAPGLPFAGAASVRELRSVISAGGRAGRPPAAGAAAPADGGIPWSFIGIGLAVLVLGAAAFAAMNRRSAAGAPAAVAGPGYGAAAASPSWGPSGASPTVPAAPASPGLGSGLLGGLATGAAVGAGVVAGEALMHRLLDGHRDTAMAIPPVDPARVPGTGDLGGSDFGIADASTWDDAGGDFGGDAGSDWS